MSRVRSLEGWEAGVLARIIQRLARFAFGCELNPIKIQAHFSRGTAYSKTILSRSESSFDFSCIGRKGRFFWRQPDGTCSSNTLGAGPEAVRKQLDEYFDIVTRFEEQDEQATSAADYFSVVYGLAPIHRSARNMHQALQHARELCPQDRDIFAEERRDFRYGLTELHGEY